MSTMDQIPHNEDIVFRGMKSPIVLASTVGDSIFASFVIVLLCIDMYARTGMNVFLASMLLCVFPAWGGIYGLLSWKSEVHIVSSYREKEGGVYRKCFGVFSIKTVETSITRSTPDIMRETSVALRVWRLLTGQGVSKVTLRSDGQTIIPSELMPTNLYDAIARVKGEPVKRVSKSPSRVSDLTLAIRSSYGDGLISKRRAGVLINMLLEAEV